MPCTIVRLAGDDAFSRGRGCGAAAGASGVAFEACDAGTSEVDLLASTCFILGTGMTEAGIKAGEDAAGAVAGVVGELLFSDLSALALAALRISFSHRLHVFVSLTL